MLKMAAKGEGENERNGCTLQWNIENISHCWPLKKGEKIKSHSFVADALKETKWSLWLYPRGAEKENYVAIGLHRERDCTGPNHIEVSFQIAVLEKKNSVLKTCNKLKYNLKKGATYVIREFEAREKVFFTEREMYLPEDTLTIQCTLWIEDRELIKSQHLFATTVFKLYRLPLILKINQFSSYIYGKEKKIEDAFDNLGTSFEERIEEMGEDLKSLDDNIIYCSLKVSIIDSEGRKNNLVLLDILKDDPKTEKSNILVRLEETTKENEKRYFPNDVLSLEHVLTFVNLDNRKNVEVLEKDVSVKSNKPNTGKEETKNTGALLDDLKILYKDGVSSDTELRTSTKTYPAHKTILSARSPVFRSLFSSDMREKNSGHVDITDLEDDTIHRMLLYMYTDSLEDLQFESAFELYKAADKYQLVSLKSRCSSFLKKSLCPSNACDLLVLADLHSDADLKGVVQEYILGQNRPFFCSQEWKEFMKIHIQLASDVMYQKMCQD